MDKGFDDKLKAGLLGESVIARWLIRRGYNILPAYEIEITHGKGPRLFTANAQLISPDMLVFNQNKIMWVEAKTKSAFTWHRDSKTWQTGIDYRHWCDYVRVANLTSWTVWILFLHKAGIQAKDTPPGMVSPCGLYGNSINVLSKCIHHRYDDFGPTGMVYWTIDSLKKLASLDELRTCFYTAAKLAA